MKKIISLICILALLAGGATLFYIGADNGDTWYKMRVADSNLYNFDGYIDYAKEVYFDVEEHPELKDTGLFWAKWNESEKEIELVHADTQEGAALIDENKPTVINVHGMLTDGHYQTERFYLNSKVNFPEDFGLEGENVSMLYLWIREGWNVGVFHYNKFASDMPKVIENKIWSAESAVGVRYKDTDGKLSDPYFTDYCLAEHFAAEYIRAMQLLPLSMGKEEIRVTAHSMGGQLATAGIFLLTELAAAGQLPHHQLPDRYALLDAFFSVKILLNGNYINYGASDVNISWSNKPLPSDYTGRAMIECLKDMKANGIVLEYYVFDKSTLRLAMVDLVEDLRELSPYTVVLPDYGNINSEYTVLIDGHNGVREWYMVSILSPPIKDVTEGRDTGALAPSASMDTDTLKSLVGKAYTISEGATTPNCDDDAMIMRYSIYYELNGGANNGSNPDRYTILSNTITLRAPRRSGYIFDGWYTTANFTGQKIEKIEPTEKKDIKLYAKWIEK